MALHLTELAAWIASEITSPRVKPVQLLIGSRYTVTGTGLYADPGKEYRAVEPDVVKHRLLSEGLVASLEQSVSPYTEQTGDGTAQSVTWHFDDLMDSSLLDVPISTSTFEAIALGVIVRIKNPRDNLQSSATIKLEGVSLLSGAVVADAGGEADVLAVATMPNDQQEQAPPSIVAHPDENGEIEVFLGLVESCSGPLSKRWTPAMIRSTVADAGGPPTDRTYTDVTGLRCEVTAVTGATVRIELCANTTPSSFIKGALLIADNGWAPEGGVSNVEFTLPEDLSLPDAWTLAWHTVPESLTALEKARAFFLT